MKILLICSGGDAPGTNRFIYNIFIKFKHDVFFALSGFRGLIDNQIFPLDQVFDKNKKDEAGAVIKSGRCPEFKERKYFKIALENAKKFDCVIVMGGNGSENGAKELFENGVNTIFVPMTIDNDVLDSFYSVGFFTAVNEGIYAVRNIMPSIETMGNSCIFEVMGRKCPMIAKEVAKQVGADYVVGEKDDLNFEKIKNIILQNYIRSQSTCIILRENIKKVDEIANKLNEILGFENVKYQIVGRTQRGGKPTRSELEMVDKFAKEVEFCINKKVFGVRVLADKNLNIFVDEFRG